MKLFVLFLTDFDVQSPDRKMLQRDAQKFIDKNVNIIIEG